MSVLHVAGHGIQDLMYARQAVNQLSLIPSPQGVSPEESLRTPPLLLYWDRVLLRSSHVMVDRVSCYVSSQLQDLSQNSAEQDGRTLVPVN